VWTVLKLILQKEYKGSTLTLELLFNYELIESIPIIYYLLRPLPLLQGQQ
jgi:hypothetical protein